MPYNPFLSKCYNTYINVEVAALINTFKYLYKYVYKGLDRIALNIVRDRNINEISDYINTR